MFTGPTQKSTFALEETRGVFGVGTVLVVSVLFALSGASVLLASKETAPEPSSLGQQERAKTVVASDTLTLDEVRRMIVGIWIEDAAQGPENREKEVPTWGGGTEERKYEDGKLSV